MPPINEQAGWSLIDKVEECKANLRASPKLEFTERKGKIVRKQVALCILNMETGEILERRFWLSQAEIERANLLRKNYQDNINNLPRFVSVDSQNDFAITNKRWNNWNSELVLVRAGFSGDIYVVATNKFLIANSSIVYPEDKTGHKYSDIIYAPYSQLLHRDEIVKRGHDYIDEKVSEAFRQLRDKQVESRAYPGRLVADSISEKFPKKILVNEQTDPDALLNKAKTDEEKIVVLEKVLVRYGLNGDRAFRYTVSKTGASGMAQLMASTYSSRRKTGGIVQKYPVADLISDINLGRLEPVNAIKAEILVFDDKLSEIKNRVAVPEKILKKFSKMSTVEIEKALKPQRIFDGLTQGQLEEGMAISYNGGSSKYDINTGTLKTKARGRKAKLGLKETQGFIAKHRVIGYLKLFD